QRPSAANGVSGGDREFVETMACAAVAAGIDGLFMEVHPNPNKAMSDKHTSYSLNKVALLVERIMKIRSVL
ncbi:MAG: 3-deoxy-8-phosphooctulonate synthase, partial [Candidatus Omnitrophica bacterium]|nr:3-deoxy-8-phosphooctulonate synthase [Candidatus Omnitrophota bacterium]